ncbi:popeye domain-containing 2-like [Megalops cyprinoides]|uniref:popeye domain-containing 2-like n=1 Tax=Megalops cyprinoides TaxID=118141 RepID=UPI0018641864|nr:popeye domain-containing 2-like [Megalops cyprinoides]
MWQENSSLFGHPQCQEWVNGTEGALYQLGNTLLMLGYMGGSGVFGALYIFSFLAPSFLCHALWGWLTLCGVDVFAWNVLLVALCGLQLAHLLLRLQQHAFLPGELRGLYAAVFRPLGVPPDTFKQVARAADSRVHSLGVDETYALEGKTPINQLSFLLSGRVRVSQEDQFLHYIFPYQFLDSPEWESLKPMKEGTFQVTLTAETECRYVSWKRRKLQLLLSKERYVARLFSVMLGSDIADKLSTLNERLLAKAGQRVDIRLQSLCYVLSPTPSPRQGRGDGQGLGGAADSDPAPPSPEPIHSDSPPGDSSPETLPTRFKRRRAPLAPTDTPEL